MPIQSTESDVATLTLTVVGEYPVPVDRLWEAYADPRQLERFWGPEGWPATFTRHDMAPGGESRYHMTGPDGTEAHGWWRFLRVDPGRLIEVEDGFANEDGSVNEELPSMRMVFTFEPTESGSRFISVTHFPSTEAMKTVLEMGMLEGIESAMGQLDAVLADLSSFAASSPAEAKILSDTQVRVTRVIRGAPEQVWRAHQEPELMKRWMLGPPGWRMPVCEVAGKVGDSYRYVWEKEDATGPEDRFGFEGELLESAPPYREVTSERMIGMEGPGTVNELTFTPVAAGTLLSLVITYSSAEVRDLVLGTGMVGGMEQSYERLENELLVEA